MMNLRRVNVFVIVLIMFLIPFMGFAQSAEAVPEVGVVGEAEGVKTSTSLDDIRLEKEANKLKEEQQREAARKCDAERIAELERELEAQKEQGGVSGTTNNAVTCGSTAVTDQPGRGDKTNGELIGDIFSGVAPNDKTLEAAGEMLSPLLGGLQVYISYVILIIIGFQMFLITIDLIFMGFPFARTFLLRSFGEVEGQMGGGVVGGAGPMSPMSSMAGGGRYSASSRMARMGPGMATAGGIGGYGANSVSTPFGDLSKSRLVSDSAVSAFFESMNSLNAQGQQGVKPKFKSMLPIYIRCHVWFIVLFTVTMVLFTSPVLFQLGLKIGQSLVNMLTSIL